MQEIIPAVSKDKIVSELTRDKFIRNTNYGKNEIYVVTAHNSPNTMLEIGRLREIAFRNGGGGTGKSADIDEYDTNETPYSQLIVWDPEEKEITGGYRFLHLKQVGFDENNKLKLATTKLFHFSETFITDYKPYTIELGRSFVQPKYQSTKAGRKALFALDNLWDGLGSLVVDNPDVKYFFGKVTMYSHFNKTARDMILHFMKTIFPDTEKLLYPHNPLLLETSEAVLSALFNGTNYYTNHKILSAKVRELNENIPPLINAYMNLSSTMKTFGTAINDHFGGVEETGIMIKISDIYPEKKERHITTYISNK